MKLSHSELFALSLVESCYQPEDLIGGPNCSPFYAALKASVGEAYMSEEELDLINTPRECMDCLPEYYGNLRKHALRKLAAYMGMTRKNMTRMSKHVHITYINDDDYQ